jgi:predicted acylesterase/phospholipase RssA
MKVNTPPATAAETTDENTLTAWEVGCYRAIRTHHGDNLPAIVSGASSGALNAAGVCVDMQPATLKGVWAQMENADVYQAGCGDRQSD